MAERRHQVTNRKIVYAGSAFKVEAFLIKKTGTRFSRVIMGNVVVVLPITKDGKVLLEKQYRYPLGKTLYEIPAGHVEKGESIAAAGKRELEEETGYRASRLTHMTSFYPTPGISEELIHLYLAEGLEKTEKNLDLDEIIETVKVSKAKMLNMIKQNKIEDGKSMVALLYYLCFFKG